MSKIFTEVRSDPLDMTKAVLHVADPAHGAIDTFIGAVRNSHEGKAVTGITYDVHKPLAGKIMKDISQEAAELWPDTHYYVGHYRGVLDIGGISIIIAVSSPHRAASFEACRYVIEEIKKRLPVWKKEHYEDSISEWLPGHSLTAAYTNHEKEKRHA